MWFALVVKAAFVNLLLLAITEEKMPGAQNAKALNDTGYYGCILKIKRIYIQSPLKVLHIAPETVFFRLFKKQKNIDYHPVDIYPHLYPKGTAYFDLLNHNLPDNSFDVIICNHVFPIY